MHYLMLAILATISQIVTAEIMAEFDAGRNFDGIVVSSSKTGQHDSCKVMGHLKHKDVYIILGISVAGDEFIQIGKPEWEIPEGDYKVNMRLGLDPYIEFDASGDGKSLIIPIASGSLEEIAGANRISIVIGTDEVVASLKGSRIAVKELKKCASKMSPASKKNPFSAGAPKGKSNPFINL